MTSSADRVSDPAGSGAVLVVALAFFVFGCVAFAVNGASLLTLHAFAAFIVLSVVAASNQLVPVLTGAAPVPARVVLLLTTPLALGFLLLLSAFAGVRVLFPNAGVLLAGGATLWAGWTLARIAKAPLERRTRLAVAMALVAFVGAAGIGAAMAFALGAAAPRSLLALAPAHASLVIVAFASTFVFAVSYRFVPMFALAHTKEGRWTRWAQWLVVACGVLGALAISSPLWMRVAQGLGIAAIAGALGEHARSLRTRLRKRLDISLRYAAAAWACAAMAAVLAVVATWRPQAAAPSVALAVLGWLSISILGYAYKIVGFLAWEEAKRRRPTASPPPLGDAVPQLPAHAALVLLVLGTATAAAALAFVPGAVRAGAIIYAVGGIGAVAVLVNLAWRYLPAK